MDILEELRQQKDGTHGKAETPEAVVGQISSYQYSVLLDNLKKIHDYLHELTSNLNHLDYTTTVDMQIPGIGAISNLHQNNYELLWENRANQNRVILNFSTHIPDSCSVKLDQALNDRLEDILEQAGINFSCDQDTLVLDGKINSSATFSINPSDNGITLSISNFEQLGRQRYLLTEKMINETFFDQMGRFLLHRENNFIELISAHTTEQSTQSDSGLHDPDSGIHTQEMDISRVRSLFNKEVQLYLTYHNTIKEIGPKFGDFIIGRSRQSNIIVNSDLASRQHARIVYRKGKYVLIDQSTNGTFVKTQGGKEVYVQGEELPLSGSGFISLGKSVTVDNEHIIYFSCQ